MGDPALAATLIADAPHSFDTESQRFQQALFQQEALNPQNVFNLPLLQRFLGIRKTASQTARRQTPTHLPYRQAAYTLRSFFSRWGVKPPRWMVATLGAVVIAPFKTERTAILEADALDRLHTHQTPQQHKSRQRIIEQTQRSYLLFGLKVSTWVHAFRNAHALILGQAPATQNRLEGDRVSFADLVDEVLRGEYYPYSAEGKAYAKRFLEVARTDPQGIAVAWQRLLALEGSNHHISLAWLLIQATRENRQNLPPDSVSYIGSLLSAPNYQTWDYLLGSLAELLGELGDPRSVPALISLLHNQNRNINGPASRALIRIGEVALPFLHKDFWDAEIRDQIVSILGMIGDPASFPLLAKAYDQASGDEDLRLMTLQAISFTRHPDSFRFLQRAISKETSDYARAEALQGIALVADKKQAKKMLPLLSNHLGNRKLSLDHRMAALFSLFFLRQRFGADFLSQALRRTIQDFFEEARRSAIHPPAHQNEFVVHKPFSSIQELRDYIAIPAEVAFVSIPPLEEWVLPTHSFEYHVQPELKGLSIALYNGKGDLSDRDLSWPVSGEAGVPLLNEAGLMGNKGILLVRRGISSRVSILPIMAKLGQLGHSHPGGGLQSDGDRETYENHQMMLDAVRRSLPSNPITITRNTVPEHVHALVNARLVNTPRDFQARFNVIRNILRAHTTLSNGIMNGDTILYCREPRLDPQLPLLQDLLAFEMAKYHFEPRIGDVIEVDHRTDGRTRGYMRVLGHGRVLIALNLDKLHDDRNLGFVLQSEAAHAVDELVLASLGFSDASRESDDRLTFSIKKRVTEVLDLNRRAHYGDMDMRRLFSTASGYHWFSFGTQVPTMFQTDAHQRALHVATNIFNLTEKARRDPKRHERLFGFAMIFINFMRTAEYSSPSVEQYPDDSELEHSWQEIVSDLKTIRSDTQWLERRNETIQRLEGIIKTLKSYVANSLSAQPLLGQSTGHTSRLADYAANESYPTLDRSLQDLHYVSDLAMLRENPLTHWILNSDGEPDLLDFMFEFLPFDAALETMIDQEFASVRTEKDLRVALQNALDSMREKSFSRDPRMKVILDGIQRDLHGRGRSDSLTHAPLNFLKNTLPGLALGFVVSGDLLGSAVGALINHFMHEWGHMLEASRQGKSYKVSWFMGIPNEVTVTERVDENIARRIATAGPLLGGLFGLILGMIGFATGHFALLSTAVTIVVTNIIAILPMQNTDGATIWKNHALFAKAA